MTSRKCETCIKRKTVYCPNSIECMATDDKPYYQNRIMLLEENQELKKQLEEYQLQNINLREDIMVRKIAFPNKLIKDKTFYNLYDMPTYEELLAQQKEFIKYLEDYIKEMEEEIGNSMTEPYKKSHTIRRNVYQEILQKYKKIIGGRNE